MPIKLLLSLFLTISLFTGFTHRLQTTAAIAVQTDSVYLCEGPYSKVYHASPNCRGLSRCSTKIYKVSLAEAIKQDRRPCKIEYR
jgi:hypothetical protein